MTRNPGSSHRIKRNKSCQSCWFYINLSLSSPPPPPSRTSWFYIFYWSHSLWPPSDERSATGISPWSSYVCPISGKYKGHHQLIRTSFACWYKWRTGLFLLSTGQDQATTGQHTWLHFQDHLILEKWMAANRLALNFDKTEFLWFSTPRRNYLISHMPFQLVETASLRRPAPSRTSHWCSSGI